MACMVILRAIFVRLLFACHGLIGIWRLYAVTMDPRYWLITTALVGLLGETILTMYKKKGNEWKWLVPKFISSIW